MKTIVGENCIVHSVDAAVKKLRELESQLVGGVTVRKRKNKLEAFKLSKLHNSLNALCAKAGIEDAVLPELVAQGVHAAVRSAAAGTGFVESEQIKRFVFDQLEELSRETDKLYEEKLKQAARGLRDAWDKYQRVKDDERALEELAREEKLQKDRINVLESENTILRRTLQDYEKQLTSAHSELRRFESVLAAVEAAKQQFDDNLEFHKQAIRSAGDTPYRDPDKVYYALSLLAQYARERRERFCASDSQSARLPLDVWLKEKDCPFEFAPHESETTRNNAEARKERTVSHAGTLIVLEKHLKIGKGDANACCRIFFEIMDSEGGKILIGHIGRHLKTAARY